MQDFEAIEQNLRVAMRMYRHATPHGAVVNLPGVEIIASGLPLAMFNAALLSSPAPGPEGDLARRVTLARVHFNDRRLPWSFWLCEDLLDAPTQRRLRRTMNEHGLHAIAEPAGMLLDALLPPRRVLPTLQVRRVCDAATRQDFCHVTASVFDLPFGVARQIYDQEIVWMEDVEAHVGYLHGSAITTAAVVPAAGVLGLYSVATLPQQQRRGCAEALLRHVLPTVWRRTGLQQVVLQSSRAGVGLYERLGFRPAARFTIYLAN